MRRLGRAGVLAVVVLAGLAFSAGQTPGKGVDRIILRGAHSGTHLKLIPVGERLFVHGHMARKRQLGCRFTVFHREAVCSLSGVRAIRVDTGSSDDEVEVLEPLPVRLTVLLGPGSDKFTGSGERDFCFPGAARRNRCIGHGGDDVCITGPRNTDCVGGRGNDYCRASTGSDGCWGGPGRDFCSMGPGHDGCHGGGGRDRLYGGSASDRLYGGGGFDYCDGGRGVGRSHGCEAGPRH